MELLQQPSFKGVTLGERFKSAGKNTVKQNFRQNPSKGDEDYAGGFCAFDVFPDTSEGSRKKQISQMKGNGFAVAKRGILVFTGRRSEVRCISGRLDVCLSSFKRRRRIPQHLPDRICEHLFPSHVYFGEEKHLPWFSSDVLGDI